MQHVGATMAKQSTTTPMIYDKDQLFEAYVSIMAFQRRLWETTFDVFLKNPPGHIVNAMTRGDVLDIVAPNLFDVLTHACILTACSNIASLLDPRSSQKDPSKMNLVMRRVVDDLAPPIGTPERAAIEADLGRVDNLAKPILLSRNKIGAHNDLSMNLAIARHYAEATQYPLPVATVGDLEEIMDCLVRITDAIVGHFRPGQQWYKRDIEIDRFFDVLTKGILQS
jgi:AbiU2